MKTLKVLEKSKSFWFLFINLLAFFFLRFPSLFEPYWYGDEGVYQTLGMGMNQGRLLYQQIFDNKPPLLYVFYSLFNGDQFWLRFLSLIFGIFAIIAFFYLAKKLFTKTSAIYLSTAVFTLLFGLPVIEGNIANAENFMLFFIVLGFYWVINNFATKSEGKMFLFSGIALGLAFLFKIVAAFDFATLIIFFLIIKTPSGFQGKLYIKFLKEIKDLYLLIIGFFIPILVCMLFFLSKGAFSDFITATFFTNVGYVGYGNKLIIPQGLLILKLILLFIYGLLLFAKRHKFTKEAILILIWVGFSLFNALFSQRPYTHYLLVLLPSFALLLGLFLQEKKLRQVNFLMIIAVLILAFENFWIYTKVVPYYKNFIDFVADNKSLIDYQKFFDKKTPTDYQIAQYIKTRIGKDDLIFIWGNNPQLYKLTNTLPPGKYTVAYHIKNYKDGVSNTNSAFQKTKPKFIVLMPNAGDIPISLSGYKSKVMIGEVYIYERAF